MFAGLVLLATRLRHSVDFDALRQDLVGMTREAFQPAHISRWLAPAPANEPDRPS